MGVSKFKTRATPLNARKGGEVHLAIDSQDIAAAAAWNGEDARWRRESILRTAGLSNDEVAG